MGFDKSKLMRNAERFLAQGKLQNAINEYKQVVERDPKDFGTLNTLGDLYTKTRDRDQAVQCYTTVAEHYSNQGFAQKAIAIYNKIAKLQPKSIEVSAKLAGLYHFKGAVNEARAHYVTVAEHFEKHGRKIDALEVRKQIAALDPTDTTVYPRLAAAYLEEGQTDAAADALAEGGFRFAKKSEHAEALDAFAKALELKPAFQRVFEGMIASHRACGTMSTAIECLLAVRESQPHDRDAMSLLIDCYLEVGDLQEGEKAIISLVEKDPTQYPRFLDVAQLYILRGDATSAARVMAIAGEHFLFEGQVAGFEKLVTDILALDPEQLEGLRLKARLAAWQRDEPAMCESLAMLAATARQKDSIDDERFALAQLVMIVPQETSYADRFREINEQFGFDDGQGGADLFDERFMKVREADASAADFAIVEPTAVSVAEQEAPQLESSAPVQIEAAETEPATEEERLLQECESIKFYIESGYLELAEKAIGELQTSFGERSEIVDLFDCLGKAKAATDNEVVVETVSGNGQVSKASAGIGIDDLRSELGIEESETLDVSDYETHYHMAVAYQEMGLLDEAIREYQDAAALVQPGDQNRRFFQCSVLLGHCFMEKAMPNLALTWYQRALETPGLGEEEKHGVWYELAAAYEADGDLENAGRYFEQVYVENIDFRDVSQRVKNVVVGR